MNEAPFDSAADRVNDDRKKRPRNSSTGRREKYIGNHFSPGPEVKLFEPQINGANQSYAPLSRSRARTRPIIEKSFRFLFVFAGRLIGSVEREMDCARAALIRCELISLLWSWESPGCT
jgi:hypothetical protein